MTDTQKYGPWAVIAGGSEGVGAEMARQLAGDGFSLVLVARKPGPLEALAEELRHSGAEVVTLQQDLLAPDALTKVQEVTDPLEVGLFVFNAGANTYRSEFVDSDPLGVQQVLDLNITAPLAFLRHFGARMKQQQRGALVVMGSVGGHVGHPFIGPYIAAKAFLRVFIEGLWIELAPHGVDVLELQLGLTRTPAMERLGMNFDAVPHAAPAVVAKEGLAHLGDGPSWIVEEFLEDAHAKASFPRRDAVEKVAEHYRLMAGS